MRKAERRSSTPTLADVVQRAAAASDPNGVEEGVSALVERLEDRDEPVTALEDISAELEEAKGAIDPQDEDPAVIMAVAVAPYLPSRRGGIDSAGDPPPPLAA